MSRTEHNIQREDQEWGGRDLSEVERKSGMEYMKKRRTKAGLSGRIKDAIINSNTIFANPKREKIKSILVAAMLFLSMFSGNCYILILGHWLLLGKMKLSPRPSWCITHVHIILQQVTSFYLDTNNDCKFASTYKLFRSN